MISNIPLKITRKQLAEFIPDSRSIRAIEQLFEQFGVILPLISSFRERITLLEAASGCCGDISLLLDTLSLNLDNAILDISEINAIINNIYEISTGLIGYSTGTGGTITQLTSKSTSVTLNKTNGVIIMDGSLLAVGTVSFVLNNNKITATDSIILNIASGATIGTYNAGISAVANGSCTISITLNGLLPLSEIIVLNFAIIKSSNT